VTLTLVVIPLVWAGFIVVSLRAFWRKSDDPAKARYYSATKFTCVFVTAGSALLLPSVIAFPGWSYALSAIYWAVICFPIALCGFYFASRIFFRVADALTNR